MNEFERHEAAFFKLYHRLKRYRARLIREGFAYAGEKGISFVLPPLEDDLVDARVPYALGRHRLPGLYAKAEREEARVRRILAEMKKLEVEAS